jgi:hypothetical protein
MTAGAPSRFFGSAGALRRMIAGQALAAQVSREVAAVPTPEQAFDAAMDLWSLCPERLLDPPDAVLVREVEQARAAWKKLKERYTR